MTEPPRYPLLFNPKARSQRGRKALRFIMDNATKFVLLATRGVEDAKELAANYAAQGESVVLAAGGDGTLNAVVQGLAGTDTALGVLPTGTMNVFARELGIPVPGTLAMPLDKALEVVEEGFVKEVDLFEVNEQPFLQMAGIGFDAQIIESTTWEMKKRLGPLSYLLSAVKVLGDDPPKLTIHMPDGSTTEGVAVIAGNGGLYGGQIKLFHKADNTDDLLDVLIFKDTGYKFVLDSLKGMAVGEVDTNGETFEYHQVEELRVTCDEERPLQVDGELVGRSSDMLFKQGSSKLKVLAPETPLPSTLAEKLKGFLR